MAVLAAAAPAAAGSLDRWERVTTQQQTGIDQIGLSRTGDGTLHVAWKRRSGPLSDDLFHTPITAAGGLGSATPIVTGWGGLTDPALVPEPGGGIRVFFGGGRSTNPGEPLIGLITATAPASGSPWALAPAPVYTGDFAYARSPAAAVAGDGTPFQAWYSAGQTVVHRGLSPATPTYPYGPGDSSDIRQNLARDTSSGRMFVVWCAFGASTKGVLVQELNTASGAPAGAAQKLPGSSTVFEGAEHSTCNLEKGGIIGDQTPFVSRPGGGLFVAGSAGYPTQNRLLVWRLGSDGVVQQTTTVASSPGGVGTIALAATGDGRIVVAWTERAGAQIKLRGSNELGTEFGPVVTLRAVAGTADVGNVDLAAQTSVVDVLARFVSTGGVHDLWHTQVETPPPPFPPVIAPTPPAAPPRPPRDPPAPYGSVSRSFVTLLAGARPVVRVPRAPGFRAHFTFASRPRAGSSVKISWYYNNRKVGEVPQPLAARLQSTVRSRGGLPRGYFRALLEVRLRGGSWRAVDDARARVG
jgi:hypothetical protein